MKDPFFDGLDEGVQLEKAVAPMPMKQSFVDWRSSRGQIRVSRSGEDGDMQAWTSLFNSTPLALLDLMYTKLRGQPVFYNLAVAWLEEQRAKETRVPEKEAPKDWKYDLYTLLTKPRPTPKEKAAIDYLFKMAEAEGLRSLNINETIRTGAKVYHDKVQAGTVAASMATRPDIITRLQRAGLIK